MSEELYVFNNELVDFVSSFLQGHMGRKNISELTADQCANLLHNSGVLPFGEHPKQGFRFRQMLRDGRDGKILLVQGAFQERPNTRWKIRQELHS